MTESREAVRSEKQPVPFITPLLPPLLPYGHQNRAGDHPDNALQLWQRFFNDLYAESATAPMFTTFQLHPYVSSRLGRTSALKEMIEYMKGTKVCGSPPA